MDRIYSAAEPGKLLHLVFRRKDLQSFGRRDIVPDEEGLQVAMIKMKNGQTFHPHKHIPRSRQIARTQEAWAIIHGVVRVTYYDTNDAILDHRVLNAGDVTVTLEGGHNYQSFTEGALVVECKTGPFIGVAEDKVLIECP
jgi:hypothetical protein